MKKSNLFKKFEIKKSKLPTIVGGFLTSIDSDTNSSGGSFDILESSNDDNGNYIGLDSVRTGPGDKDKPDTGSQESLF